MTTGNIQYSHHRDTRRRRKGVMDRKPVQKIMTENFPKLVRDKVMQIPQEAQRVPIKRDPKRPSPRHITIKTAKFKDKERILKTARQKQ